MANFNDVYKLVTHERDLNQMTVKEMVIRILDQYPDSRYNDMVLAVKVYEKFYDIRSIHELLKPGIPQYETIRRIRQQIQAEGLYSRDRGKRS